MCTICLGMLLGLPHLQMAGWVKYIWGPNSNIVVGKQFCSFLWRTGLSGGAPDMPRVLSVKSSRWSFRRWRTGHGAPDGPVCTGQPMSACRILTITFSSELRFRWSCNFWKAYEILYILELKAISVWVNLAHRTGQCAPDIPYATAVFQQFLLRIVGITFSSELRFWWSWTFWKAYKIVYISELNPCQFE
jgi:hypothetical protein